MNYHMDKILFFPCQIPLLARPPRPSIGFQRHLRKGTWESFMGQQKKAEVQSLGQPLRKATRFFCNKAEGRESAMHNLEIQSQTSRSGCATLLQRNGYFKQSS